MVQAGSILGKKICGTFEKTDRENSQGYLKVHSPDTYTKECDSGYFKCGSSNVDTKY